ncbi:MAG: hypothetical protein ACYDBH_14235, partial [Acidobacteriaceae bacterium]
PESRLPAVMEPGAALGTIESRMADRLGLGADVRIHATIGDSQAAYLGSGCGEHELLLNFGTGSQSMWETDVPLATNGTDIRYLRDGRYLACAPTLAGGEAYRITAEFFRDVVRKFSRQDISVDEIVTIMDRLAAESDAAGITFEPIFSGSKFRRVGERASIRQIARENFRPGALVRALVVGMVEEVARPYFGRNGEMMHARLVGAGSALRNNEALRKVAEERFGRPLRLPACSDEAALGAALLCLPDR